MVFNRKDDDGFSDRNFLSLLMAPFKAVRDGIADAFSGSDSSFRGSGSNPVVGFLTLPFRLLWGFAVFMVQAWTTSRNGIAFLRGFPAFAIMAFTPFFIVGPE